MYGNDSFNPYQYWTPNQMPIQQPVNQPIQNNIPMQSQPQTRQNGLIWVQGIAGAKSYMVEPGKSVLLMDSEDLRFYIKSADNDGIPLPLRIFDYTERSDNSPKEKSEPVPDMKDYITREEFENKIKELKGMSDNESII